MQMPSTPAPESGEGTLNLCVRRSPQTNQPELAILLPEQGLEMSFDVDEAGALIHDLEEMHLQMRTILAQWFEAEVPGDDSLHLVPATVFDARSREQMEERTLSALCGLAQGPNIEWLLEPLDEGAEPCGVHTCISCLGLYHEQVGAPRG